MRRPRNCCSSCGGRRFVDAVDNFGNPYKGCANCRILSMEEINAILAKGSPCTGVQKKQQQ